MSTVSPWGWTDRYSGVIRCHTRGHEVSRDSGTSVLSVQVAKSGSYSSEFSGEYRQEPSDDCHVRNRISAAGLLRPPARRARYSRENMSLPELPEDADYLQYTSGMAEMDIFSADHATHQIKRHYFALSAGNQQFQAEYVTHAPQRETAAPQPHAGTRQAPRR
jgi:hypothetical protein